MNVSLKEWQEHLETGIKYLGEGNLPKAEEYLEQSLRLAEKIGVLVIIAFSQRLLATAQTRNNKLDKAESGFKKALEYCLELKNSKGISEAKAGLASVYFVKGEYMRSAGLYKQAINIYPHEASPLRLTVLYSDLGQVYGRMQKWDKAIDNFLKAGVLCKENGYTRGEAEINLHLGEVYYSQGKLITAKDHFSKAGKLFALIDDQSSLANTLQYLAFILLERNMLEEALLMQYRVITLFFKHWQKPEISEGYFLLSSILQYARLLDEAEESIILSLQYYNGYEFGFAVRYHSLAVIAIMKKEYVDAKRYYYNALKYFQFYGDGTKVGEISEELTYLLKYEDTYIQKSFSKWMENRKFDVDIPKFEIMISLAHNLKKKGNNFAALRCSWRALEIAKTMKCETQEIEKLIQNLSERIRKRNKLFDG